MYKALLLLMDSKSNKTVNRKQMKCRQKSYFGSPTSLLRRSHGTMSREFNTVKVLITRSFVSDQSLASYAFDALDSLERGPPRQA
jgi:hypothetical protein